MIIQPATQLHDDGDRLIVRRVQDVSSVLEENKAAAADFSGQYHEGLGTRMAQIPLVLVEKWLNEEGVNVLQPGNEDFLRRKLNSSEYAYLRTAPGRI